MLLSVALALMVDPFLDQLVDLWGQEEGDVYEVLPHGVEVGSGTLLLEDLEVVEVLSELTKLLLASLPVDSAHLLPDGVHINYLIGEEFVIRETSYDVVDLLIAPSEEQLHTLLDLSLPLNEIVIELLNELLAFLECLDVPLPPRVPLVLNHVAALFGAVHLQVEACPLDLLLVDLGSPLLGCQHGLLHLFHGFERLQLLLS